MIASDHDFGGAPLLRNEYRLDRGHGPVEHATLTVSALGVVEAWVNGHAVSIDLLTPGWSSYEWRVRYATYTVTDLLDEATVLGLALGNGWYRGRLGWAGLNELYGKELGGFAQLRIKFADGHEQIVGTDTSWAAGPSSTTRNDIYDGQSIDARSINDRWLHPGAELVGWVGVHELEFDHNRLEPYIGPPVIRQDEVVPKRVWTSPQGHLLVDFGQNLVGWVRVRVQGASGEAITVRHAEVLEHGELGTRPLRSAQATDEFILSGGVDVFEPTFTFHGFQYIEVTGWPGGEAALRESGGLIAVVVGSRLTRIGTFESSHLQLNQLHLNTVWGMRGNFVDVPTDCPQRDERLGWTGDIAVFAPTAAFLYDIHDFLTDWLRDLALEQSANNSNVPTVVPDVIKYFPESALAAGPVSTAIWSDAAVWVPWALWMAYGKREVLEAQYDSMAAHVRCVRGLLSPEGLWDSGFQFGDWLDPDAPPDNPLQAKADPGVVATICAFRSSVLAAAAAKILNRSDDSAEFTRIAERIKHGFTTHYLISPGLIHSDSATVYSLAIAFDILDDRQAAGRRLAELVEGSGFRISTGFAGTPYILDALSSTGYLDRAYKLLLQTEMPSWLYPVTMGATTIWERWDSMLPDGSINQGEMTSFNHYALGAVIDWVHRTVGGIAPLEPGYRRVLVAPQPGGGITHASTSLATPHGSIAVYWELLNDEFHLDVTIPPGVEAVVRIPGARDEIVGDGTFRRVVPMAATGPVQPQGGRVKAERNTSAISRA